MSELWIPKSDHVPPPYKSQEEFHTWAPSILERAVLDATSKLTGVAPEFLFDAISTEHLPSDVLPEIYSLPIELQTAWSTLNIDARLIACALAHRIANSTDD